jgi:hypothetical protein
MTSEEIKKEFERINEIIESIKKVLDCDSRLGNIRDTMLDNLNTRLEILEKKR